MTRIEPATTNREINRPLDSILVVKVLSHFLGSCYNLIALYQSIMLASAKQDSLSLVAQGFEIEESALWQRTHHNPKRDGLLI